MRKEAPNEGKAGLEINNGFRNPYLQGKEEMFRELARQKEEKERKKEREREEERRYGEQRKIEERRFNQEVQQKIIVFEFFCFFIYLIFLLIFLLKMDFFQLF